MSFYPGVGLRASTIGLYTAAFLASCEAHAGRPIVDGGVHGAYVTPL